MKSESLTRVQSIQSPFLLALDAVGEIQEGQCFGYRGTGPPKPETRAGGITHLQILYLPAIVAVSAPFDRQNI